MNARNRLWKALHHQEPDRVPFDLGGTDVTGLHITAYGHLLTALGMEEQDIAVLDPVQQLARPHESVLDRLHVDTRGLFPNPGSGWSFIQREDETYSYFTDEWGITWKRPKRGGLYFDMALHPLEEANLAVLKTYPWPDARDPERLRGLREAAKHAHDSGYATVLAGLIGGGLMETGTWLAGFRRFYRALVREQEFACALMDKILELKMEFWEMALTELGEYVDIIEESEDLGFQEQLILSLPMFRKLLKPRWKKLFRFIHDRFPVAIFLHSCGSIFEVIPDLIEIGIDILNPVQVSAAGMDTRALKREYGDDIVFWGGIDTQKVLPFGTLEQVEQEVKRRIDDLAPGGGYVLASVHNIQADVPAHNVLAMWKAWRAYGDYDRLSQGAT